MAMSLRRVLKAHQGSFSCVCLLSHTRFLASKAKSVGRIKQPDQLRVKSLFVKQKKSEKLPATSYRKLLQERHDQASRSVLVRVHQSPQGVCDSLQALGPVKAAFIIPKAKNYLLVEFAHKDTVGKLLRNVTYFPEESQIPVCSRLLYHMQSFHVQRHQAPTSVFAQQVSSRELTAEDYQLADSVISQMENLHSIRQLSDVGYRLRYFICSMVEDLVRPILPFCRINPFGSSSNGFGWEGCDLDMMMSVKPLLTKGEPGSKFRFLTKLGSGDDRVFGQQCLDVVGEMMRVFMPSAYWVNKVLNARVPIIKFHYEATQIDCDLSYLNVSGTKMSELMFLLGETDQRVRVLMTTIKEWAKSCDLTRPHPGPWPANFTLLAMLICFLQSRSPPVLPALRILQSLAGPEDHFIIDDVDYAFVTDVTKISKSSNTQSVDELLVEFFHHFAHFNFSTQGLSLIEGSIFSKNSTDPMHVENPLDICHNVSKNVNALYINKLQEAAMTALHCLETKRFPTPDKQWGLFCLFNPPSHPQTSGVYSVAGLFSQDQTDREGSASGDENPDSNGLTPEENSLAEGENESLVSESGENDSHVVFTRDAMSEVGDADAELAGDGWKGNSEVVHQRRDTKFASEESASGVHRKPDHLKLSPEKESTVS